MKTWSSIVISKTPITITLTGRGVEPTEPGSIETVPALEFGLVEEEVSAEKTLTVNNTGEGPLTVVDAWTDPSSFTVQPIPGEVFPLVVNPGSSRNVTVTFTPLTGSAGTTQAGTLTINSDDPDDTNLIVSLQGQAIEPELELANNPVVSARVHFNPFDLITADTCSNVGGQVEFGNSEIAATSFQVVLTDTGGTSVTSSSFAAPSSAGTATFDSIDACGLGDGFIAVKVITEVDGQRLSAFSGTPAVKNTSALTAPALDPVEPVVIHPTVQVCGTSVANTTVRVEGGSRTVSATLDSTTTEFCLDVPLKPNSSNTLIASAINDLAVAPKPIASAQPITVEHVDPSEIIVAEASSRPLSVEEVENLVENGVIDLDDPSNFNVSMFTVVLTIGSFPVAVTQPIIVPSDGGYTTGGGGGGGGGGGHVYYGQGGSGWSSASDPPPQSSSSSSSMLTFAVQTPKGLMPGVIIIDGRIKTLKEFFQVTIAIQNTDDEYIFSKVNASIVLPAGVTAIRAGLGTDVAVVNTAGEIDSVVIGDIQPESTGTGQFIVRGDSIGTHRIDVDFTGFLTGGEILTPIAVAGSAETTIDVYGPPELDVIIRHPSRPGVSDDVYVGEIYPLTVEMTNISSPPRPALYSSLELFVGGNARLVDENGDPIEESNEIRDFGHILPGESVSATFMIESLAGGDIIACQGLAAENLTLTVDTGPQGTPCNIANTYPANFEPLPADAAPTLLGISPLNNQPNIPVTTSVLATLTPESSCLVADTWKNVQTAPIDPSNTGLGYHITSAQLVDAGNIYLEELDAFGSPVKHIPVELYTETPPAGGATIVVLRLGLPGLQYFLKENTRYRATIKGGTGSVCSAVSGATMENNFVWTFSTEQTCKALTTPDVVLTAPAQGSIDRPLSQVVQLDFTARMDPASLTYTAGDLSTSSFGVYTGAEEIDGELSGGTAVAGKVTLGNYNQRLIFTPTASLPQGETIYVRLTDALHDSCGNPLQTAANGVKLFHFATEVDDGPPEAPLVNPLPTLTNQGTVLVSGSAEAGSLVTVSASAGDRTAIATDSGLFNLYVPLLADQSNSLTVFATDAMGNISPETTVAQDGSALLVTNDSTSPVVVSTVPADGSTVLPRDTAISIAFSEFIDPDTVNTLNVSLRDGTQNVAGSLTLDGGSGFTFTPAELLNFGTTYSLTMRDEGISDRAGNHLGTNVVISVTTEPYPPPTLSTVTPISGVQGTSVSVTFEGSNLATASAVESDNPGISGTLDSVTATQVVATLTLSSTADIGPTFLNLVTAGGTASLLYTVLQKTPDITEIVPGTVVQGQTINAEIRGTGLTHVSGLVIDDTEITLTNRGTGDLDDNRIDVTFAVGFDATVGEHSVSVTTTGGSTTGTFAVTANQVPVAHAGSDQTVTEGDLVTLSAASSYDPDNHSLSYTWEILEAPEGSTAVFDDAALSTPSFMADLPGTYRANLTVSDSRLSASDEIVITAIPVPETITLSPANAQMFTRGSMTMTASLDAPAPAGGQLIALSTDDAALSSPANVTVPAGASSVSFTLTSEYATGTATVSATAPDIVGDQATVEVTLRQFSVIVPLVGIDRTITGTLTLNDPAPPGGATIDLSTLDSDVATISPAALTIAQGQTTATFEVTGGSAIGFTDVVADGNADGFASVSKSITVTNRLIDLPGSRVLALGETMDIPVLIAPDPAPVGGVPINIVSSDPSLIEVLTPIVTVAEGEFIAYVQVRASSTATGAVSLTAGNAGYGPDTATVQVTSGLAIAESSVQFDSTETGHIYLNLTSGGEIFTAPAGGITLNLSSSDDACVAVPETLLLPEGSKYIGADLSYGGTAGSPCSAVVTASHALFGSDTVNVTVAEQLDDLGSITLTDNTYPYNSDYKVGGGLQDGYQLTLSGGNHGGVTISVRSDNPDLAVLAKDATSVGSPALDLVFADGESSKTIYVQGVPGSTGSVTLTASEPRFTDGTVSVEVVQPTFRFINLITSQSTNIFDRLADDPFYLRVGYMNGTSFYEQPVSAAAGPLTVDLSSSDTSLASLTTTSGTAGTAQVVIPVNSYYSPTSVTAGGAAVSFPAYSEPVTSTVDITASTNHATATASVDITVAAGSITLTDNTYTYPYNHYKVGGGLQDGYQLTLSGGNHGGATVRISSSDPTLALVSPDSTTAGSDYIDLVFAGGESSKTIYVQGVPGSTGSVTLTASEPRFTDGTASVEVVQPVLRLGGLAGTTNTAAANDPFYVDSGYLFSGAFYVQSVVPTETVHVLLESDNENFCQLVTAATTGLSVTVDIQGGTSRSPSNVATGGVALNPIEAGTCTISATSLDFDNSYSGATQQVVISP